MEKLCGYVFKTMRVDIYWDIYRYTFHKSSNLRRVWLCFILCLDIPYPCSRSLYVIFVCLVTQTYSTLCDPMDHTPPGSPVHGDSSGKNTGLGCHALLQGTFLTQEENPDFPHYMWILYWLSHQRNEVSVTQSCPTLCDPMGYTAHGILQAIKLSPCNI